MSTFSASTTSPRHSRAAVLYAISFFLHCDSTDKAIWRGAGVEEDAAGGDEEEEEREEGSSERRASEQDLHMAESAFSSMACRVSELYFHSPLLCPPHSHPIPSNSQPTDLSLPGSSLQSP